jgi:hypothetical protein
MAIDKGRIFSDRDVYIDYPFEEVMFHWDHVEQKVYVRFHGKAENRDPVPHDNRLFNDALLSGSEISPEQYERGNE